jgi:hypothetical protein
MRDGFDNVSSIYDMWDRVEVEKLPPPLVDICATCSAKTRQKCRNNGTICTEGAVP